MILGDSPPSPHDLHHNYERKLIVPCAIFSADDVSFTYPDSVFHLPVEDLGRVYLERNPTPTVYRVEDLETLIETYKVYDYMNHYIEVQVWNDEPLKVHGYWPSPPTKFRCDYFH